MRYLKAAGIGWGIIYFMLGAINSFTLNANDTWTSVALLFALCLLPLPITIIAVWLPKVAGRLLLGCVAINAVALAAFVNAQHTYPFSSIIRSLVIMILYNIPHLFFSIIYLKTGQRKGRVAQI